MIGTTIPAKVASHSRVLNGLNIAIPIKRNGIKSTEGI